MRLPAQRRRRLHCAWQRRRLRRELIQCETELATAEAARDDLLARLAHEKRIELAQSEAFRRLLEPLGDLDRQTNSQRVAQRATLQEQDAELYRLDAELALLAPELATTEKALAHLRTVLVEREQKNRTLVHDASDLVV